MPHGSNHIITWNFLEKLFKHWAAINLMHNTFSKPQRNHTSKMKIPLLPLSSLLFISFVSGHSSRVCQDYIIPVNVTSLVYTAIYPPFQDNYDVVGFVKNLARRDTNATVPPSQVQRVLLLHIKLGAHFALQNQEQARRGLFYLLHMVLDMIAGKLQRHGNDHSLLTRAQILGLRDPARKLQLCRFCNLERVFDLFL